MIQMNLHQVSAIVGGSLVGKEARIQGVSTDSRQDCDGRLFVALSGPNHDGAAFCQAAVQQGAAAVLVSRAVDVSVPQVICQDVLSALQALAAAWIRQTGVKVIAVTGSNGKTTVKNMLASVLSQRYQTFATPGNLNNEVGVPLSLLAVSPQDEVAVIEMGAAEIGDIKHLTELVPPDVALVTNVSAAHVGRFGGLDQVAQGKSEIYAALSAQGVAVINADLPYAAAWQQQLDCAQLTFGQSDEAHFQLITTGSEPMIKTPMGDEVTFQLPVLGLHNQINACAVMAVASALSLDWAEVIEGLAQFTPPTGRLNLIDLPMLRVIDDSYNANPASVKAAIDVLKQEAKPQTLIIGDMAELGDESIHWHREIGAYAQAQGIDHVIAVGEYASSVCEFLDESCDHYADTDALLAQGISLQGTVLVKGSRSMRMERVVQQMTLGVTS